MPPDGAVAGVETETGEHVALAAVVSNATPCGRTASCSPVRRPPLASKDGAATSRPARASCSTSASIAATTTCCITISSSPAIPTRSSTSSTARAKPAPDPTCYVCAPAATEPEVAPPGGEALYVLVHTPYLRPHHDWNEMLPRYRRTILDKLERTAGLRDIEQAHPVRALADPARHSRPLPRLERGDLRPGEPRPDRRQFKPANRSPDVKRLYLAGGAATPGRACRWS